MSGAAERETWRESVVYYAYAGMERLARGLPERAGRALFAALGRAAQAAVPRLRATVARNQAQVLGLPSAHPLVRASTREAFELYARYWYDTFRVGGLPGEEFVRRMDGDGFDHVDRALEAGRGAICVLPHIGNWDIAGYWFALRGYPVVAVAEALRPKRLFDLFVHLREKLGITVVPLTGNGVGRRLAGYLQDNRIVALVADRDLAGRGIEVEMFGGKRRLPAGPAMLSLSSGAPLLLSPAFTTKRGWYCRIEPPIAFEPTGSTKRDVVALTRLLAKAFERVIAERPADWHMFQPAWEP